MCRTERTTGTTVSSIHTVLFPACAKNPVRSNAQRQYEASVTVAADRQGRLEERLGVLVEHHAMNPASRPKSGVLGIPLACDDEEGGERREDEEPVGERHSRHHASRYCSQYEARSHDGELYHWFPLEPEAVGDAQPGVCGDNDREPPWSHENRHAESHDNESRSDTQSDAGSQCSAGHGPESLDGMGSIRPCIDDVVDEVGARRDNAKDREGRNDSQRGVPFAENTCSGRSHEDEKVLEPLPRSRALKKQARR